MKGSRERPSNGEEGDQRAEGEFVQFCFLLQADVWKPSSRRRRRAPRSRTDSISSQPVEGSIVWSRRFQTTQEPSQWMTRGLMTVPELYTTRLGTPYSGTNTLSWSPPLPPPPLAQPANPSRSSSSPGTRAVPILPGGYPTGPGQARPGRPGSPGHPGGRRASRGPGPKKPSHLGKAFQEHLSVPTT